MKRAVLSLVLVLAGVATLGVTLAVLPAGQTVVSAAESDIVLCAPSNAEFKLGFQLLADQIPEVAGVPLEDEHWGANGDSLQMTSAGLMAWRKADNWTAFTNGATTWINGPFGVQSRPNDVRFCWEGDANQGECSGADAERLVPIAPVLSPSESATPSPTHTPAVVPSSTPVPVATIRPTLTPLPTLAPLPTSTVRPDTSGGSCCRVCRTGKACGDSCINVNYTCRQPAGCACNG